jgi:hypothetical protein
LSAFVSPASTNYLKTTVACLVGGGSAALIGVLGHWWLSPALGAGIAVAGAMTAVVAFIIAMGGLIVMHRDARATRAEPDLFLTLNRSREPEAINTRRVPRRSALRRWMARRTLGHDFLVGDLLEVKSWPEIHATLDERGCLEELPFLPEMLRMCGQRAYVFRCAHRIFDYRKTRRMRHLHDGVLLVGTVCDGSRHGGCDAGCHTIWKSAWLRRISPHVAAARPAAGPPHPAGEDVSLLEFGTHPPRFVCQLTQLQAASRPVSRWSPVNFVRPLVAGNVSLAAFLVGWLTYLFNRVQYGRGGVAFPAFDETALESSDGAGVILRPGDAVIVRSPAEIRATLNDEGMNRGMWFEPDMMKHCRHPRVIQAEIRTLIDIVTGELRTMKTPAYVLRDVHFSGERQLFNAQYEPLFWRSAWLRRDEPVQLSREPSLSTHTGDTVAHRQSIS